MLLLLLLRYTARAVREFYELCLRHTTRRRRRQEDGEEVTKGKKKVHTTFYTLGIHLVMYSTASCSRLGVRTSTSKLLGWFLCTDPPKWRRFLTLHSAQPSRFGTTNTHRSQSFGTAAAGYPLAQFGSTFTDVAASRRAVYVTATVPEPSFDPNLPE